MSATTLKISQELRKRIVAAAKAAEKSPHAFMLAALEQQTRLDEQRRTFVANAVASREEVQANGQVYPAAEVRRYLMARVSGRKATRPKAVAWRK
jgi:predicted transcriptional regulator